MCSFPASTGSPSASPTSSARATYRGRCRSSSNACRQGKRCFVTPARRDFCYAQRPRQDRGARRADGTGHGTYHFSSGKDVAIRELYDAVVDAMKLNDYPEPEMKPLGPDDAPSILLDPSRTFADFGEHRIHPARRNRRARRSRTGVTTACRVDTPISSSRNPNADAYPDHRWRRLSRLEPDRALAAAWTRNPGHRQFRDRPARGRAVGLARLSRDRRVRSPTASWSTGPSTVSVRRTSFIPLPPTRIPTTGARMWRPTYSARSTWSRRRERAGVKRFVNFQTALCYGRPEQVPIPVDHPCRPLSSYGISKSAGEKYLALSAICRSCRCGSPM